MSTNTLTKSVSETLFDTFTESVRKYDFRTSRGKFFKEVSARAGVTVKTGTADYIQTRWNRDYTEEVEYTTSYNALRIVSDGSLEEAVSVAETYLREVAPTRFVKDEGYNRYTIPNLVRLVLETIWLEDRVEGYGDIDGNNAFKVVSVAIDPETDKAFHIVEVVGAGHRWHSNPFISPDSWRNGDDSVGDLSTLSKLNSEVEEHRASVERGQKTQRVIDEVKEAGLSSVSWKYATFQQSCEKFVAKYAENPYELDENRPVFIDEVLAYALSVEWFIRDQHHYSSPLHARGEVLKRFTDLVRGY